MCLILSSCFHRKRDYPYTPLLKYQIRLLKVHPGDNESPICCSLKVVSLLSYDDIAAQSPIRGWERFDAISYVWGDSTGKVEIICDGIIMHVTRNLADALQRFREPMRAQILWADALCINQKDINERAAQVKLMGLIYFKARQVRIWLGKDNEELDCYRACHAVQVIVNCTLLYRDCPPDPNHESLRLCSETFFKDPQSAEHTHWTALSRLLERPWFTRVWVVQELGLSRHAVFYCGESSFSRQDLGCVQTFLLYSKTGSMVSRNLSSRMLRLGDNYWRSVWGSGRLELGSDLHEAESFFDILSAAQGLDCTDPRDMIFAFLGHPSAFKQRVLDVDPYMWYPRNYYVERPTIISPNYEQTTTFPRVCADLAITAIKEFDIGLRVMSHVAHDYHTIDMDIPSWIPRWDLINEPSQFYGSKIFFNASGDLPSTSFILDSNKKQEVTQIAFQALRLASIWHPSREPFSVPLDQIVSTMALLVGDIPARGETSHTVPPESETYPYDDTFMSTIGAALTAGLTTGPKICARPADEHVDHHLNNFHAYYRRQLATEAGTQPDPNEEERADDFESDFKLAASRRVVFLTLEGHFGLGPSISKFGDEIWLPMGAKMPLLFRPLENGSYKLISQVYLHGVMRGEAVLGKSEEDFEMIILE